MRFKHSPLMLIMLAVASCGAPQIAPMAHTDAPATKAMTLTPHQSTTKLTVAAVGPIGLINATATGTLPRSLASSAVDGNLRTRWSSGRFEANPTLTVELDSPGLMVLKTLTLNTDPFPVGTTYDVQTASSAAGPWTDAMTGLTKVTRGAATLTVPDGPAAQCKFVRLNLHNRAQRFNRVSFGVLELSATADTIAPPPPPGGGDGGTGTGGVEGVFSFATNIPAVVQYRPTRGRLRFETVGAPGAPETVALNALATEALNPSLGFTYPAHAVVTLADTGEVLSDTTVTMTTAPDEPGIIIGGVDGVSDIVEIIWPQIAEGLAGDAIIRVELANAPAGLDGRPINVHFTFAKVTSFTAASWTGDSTNVIVPAARP